MNEDILFYEKQQFRQWWIWGLFLAIDAHLIYSVINTPYPQVKVEIFALLLFALINLLFLFAKLETTVTRKGITVKFSPFMRNKKFYPWHNIQKSYIRKYKPIREYGGWGVRFGWKGGVAYNVSGRYGLQLEFYDGNPLLIGTQMPQQLTQAIHPINQTSNS